METYTEIFVTKERDHNLKGDFKLLLYVGEREIHRKEFTFFTKILPEEQKVEFHIRYKNLTEDFIFCKTPYNSEGVVDLSSYSKNQLAVLTTFFPTISFAIKALDEEKRNRTTNFDPLISNSTFISRKLESNTNYVFSEDALPSDFERLIFHLPEELVKQIKLL